jgi:hypothetical protein
MTWLCSWQEHSWWPKQADTSPNPFYGWSLTALALFFIDWLLADEMIYSDDVLMNRRKTMLISVLEGHFALAEKVTKVALSIAAQLSPSTAFFLLLVYLHF